MGEESVDQFLNTPVETVAQRVHHPALAIFDDTPLRDILAAFRRTGVQALPVVVRNEASLSGKPQVLGVLSLFSVERFTLFASVKATDDGAAVSLSEEVLKDMNWAATARDFLDVCDDVSEEKSFFFCESTVATKTLLEAFAKGVHRVITALPIDKVDAALHPPSLGAAQYNANQLTGAIPSEHFAFFVVSQSDLVHLLFKIFGGESAAAARSDPLRDFLGLTIAAADAEIGACPFIKDHVMAIESDATAATGFADLALRNIRAAPVVDTKTRAVVADLSTSDFCQIFNDDYTPLFDRNVLEFLEHARAVRRAKGTPVAAPATVKLGETLHRVVALMCLEHVHQVWVVNDLHRPVGVVSMSDLIGKFFDCFA